MITMNLLHWFLKIPEHDQNVRIPSAPSRVVILEDTIPTSEPPQDTWGMNDAGEMRQWWTPQGGSVTAVPSVGPDYWFLPENMPSDAEIIEMGVKYILMRSPLPTIPSWMIVEPEPTYA